MNMAAVQTMVVFSNDATEIRYSDGSRLQLSPCGASFTFWKSSKPRNQHSQTPPLKLLGNQRIQQRTRYVLSEYKAKVLQALEFRNQFATHPYLCTDVINQQSLVHIYSDIHEASWPASHTDADIKRLPDGAIHITSIDQCATLKLPATRQQFSVEFLCKVPREGIQRRSGDIGDANSEGVEHRHSSQNAPQMTESSEAERAFVSGAVIGDLPSERHADFLHKVSREVNQNKVEYTEKAKTKATVQTNLSQNALPKVDDLCDYGPTSGGCVYVWVVQHYSVDDCPQCWRHPLQMDLRIPATCISEGAGHESVSAQQVDSAHDESVSSTSSSSLSTYPIVTSNPADIIHTPIPSALPVNCPASHMHSWKETKVSMDATVVGDTHALEIEYAANDGIKVLMVNGVVYRLLYHPGSNNTSIEVYPGDNSVIKSCHQPGGLACDVFFTQHIAGPDGMEERMYSTSNLPPEKPGCLYSLASVLARASRLLQLARLHSDVTIGQACWKIKQQANTVPLPNPIPVVLLEEKNVTNLGRFSAYSDGYIRIAFSDRTLLDWRCDLSQCIGRYLLKTQDEDAAAMDHRLPIQLYHNQRRDAPNANCRLLLPSGQYTWVEIQQPPVEFQRYAAVAEEWRAFVNMEPSERTAFYNQQFISDPNRLVHDELKKIQHFTYMTECLLPQPHNVNPNETSKGPNLKDKQPHPASNYHERHAHNFETTDNSISFPANVASLDPKTTKSSGEMYPAVIREALSKTSQAISSIETLLEY